MPLKPDDLDDVPAALRREVLRRLDKADAALARGADGVHDARKQFKKVRATLRLLREAIGARRFNKANRAIRDAGRPLSAARDAAAMRETIAGLRRRFPRDRNALAALHAASMTDDRGVASETIEDVRTAVAEVRSNVEGWRLDVGGWRVVRDPLTDAYRRGRRAFVEAHDDETRHEARKRAKDLRYQLEFMAPLAPEAIGPLAAQARSLTDVLGEDHDLAVLRALADGPRFAAARSVIDGRRDALIAEANRLAGTLFAERPAAFCRRLHAYWRAAKAAA